MSGRRNHGLTSPRSSSSSWLHLSSAGSARIHANSSPSAANVSLAPTAIERAPAIQPSTTSPAASFAGPLPLALPHASSSDITIARLNDDRIIRDATILAPPASVRRHEED